MIDYANNFALRYSHWQHGYFTPEAYFDYAPAKEDVTFIDEYDSVLLKDTFFVIREKLCGFW